MTSRVSIPVALEVSDAPGQPEPTPELEALYRSFEAELLVPLWAEIGDLMSARSQSRAVPHLWRWSSRGSSRFTSSAAASAPTAWHVVMRSTLRRSGHAGRGCTDMLR